LELEAIVHALGKWRHYLMGKRFELRTYHNGLKYLFDQPNLNARQSMWLKFLSEYNFDIKHIKGKKIKWMMHSTRGCMSFMLQPSACIRLMLKEKFWRLQI
jgi:hypothetical protein